MGAFKMAGLTISSIFKKPETIKYPFEKKPPIEGLKGHIVNAVDACILCGMCQKACPCNCIEVDKEARKWDINPFMCILCSSCVRACPTKCLSMDIDATPIATEKYDIDMLVPEKEKAAKSAD